MGVISGSSGVGLVGVGLGVVDLVVLGWRCSVVVVVVVVVFKLVEVRLLGDREGDREGDRDDVGDGLFPWGFSLMWDGGAGPTTSTSTSTSWTTHDC